MNTYVTSPYLYTPEAAHYLRLPKATLEHWRSRGTGPAYSKLGKRVVYTRADLDAFVETRRIDNTADRDE